MSTLDDAKVRLQAGCAAIVAAEERLTDADRAIGDGDHGVGMARGFQAAMEALDTKPAQSVADLFRHVGMAVLSSAGGASGAIFGTFFISASGSLKDDRIRNDAFVAALENALASIKSRGGASEGDKTVIDALVPAIEQARSAGGDLQRTLDAAARGARQGVEATRAMRGAAGKSRALGDRAIGHVDPGALSLMVFLDAFARPATCQ